MQRFSLLLVLMLSTLATAADYVVVVSKATYAKPGWKQVADELVKKHTGTLVQYDKSLKETLPALRKHRPRFVAFVCPPETISKNEPKMMFMLTRSIDGDPFGDAIWGIVTGMDAAGAMKIVKTTEPLIIRRSLNTTGVNKSLFDEAVVISDGRKGAIEVKRNGKTTTEVFKTPDGKGADPANLFRFVKFFNEMKVDLMVTSSHACQVNLSMPFTHALLCSNITTGRLVTGMMAKMKGNSEMVVSKDGKRLEVTPRENPMVFFPVGNCLVGDCKYTPKSLIPTMISHYGVRQAAGYTVPTWYGKMGWGAWGKWQGSAGQLSLSQALFLRNQEMIVEILAMKAKGVTPPKSRAEFTGEKKKLYGHIHDLSVVPLYGDPAWVAKFDETKKPDGIIKTTFTKKDDVYTLTIKGKELPKLIKGGYSVVLPIRLPRAVGTADIEILEGKQFAPLVADDFIVLRKGGHTGNETKIVFKLLPPKPKAIPAPKADPAPAEPKPAPAEKKKALDDATLQLAATDWFEAIFGGKADAALKLSQAPFQMDRKKVLYTMEELKAFYKEIAENQRGKKLPPYEAKVLAVVPEKLAKLPCLAGTKAVKIMMEDGDEVMYVFVDPATGKVCGFSD